MCLSRTASGFQNDRIQRGDSTSQDLNGSTSSRLKHVTCYCISTPAAIEVFPELLARLYDYAYYVLELSLKTCQTDLKLFEDSAHDQTSQVR